MKSWVMDHLEKLKAFAAIVKYGSLVRAGTELGVSQPALSRLVTSLEDASGKKLLERSRLGCVPTSEGKEVVRFYERLHPMAEDLAQKIEAADEFSGKLVIATFESFAVTWWPGFVKEFMREYPGIKLSIRTSAPDSHREKLLNGAVDIVIESTPEQNDRVTSLKVGSDNFSLYVAKNCKNERDLPLVYVPHAKDEDGVSIYDLMQERGVGQREVFELDSFSTVYEFISAGIGLGPLPMQMFNKFAKHGQIKPAQTYKSSFGSHSVCASFLSQNRTDQRIREFVRRLKAHLTKRI